MKVFEIDENHSKGHIVLANMGDSIESFCNNFNMPLLLCHRHLILDDLNNFGTIVISLLKLKQKMNFNVLLQKLMLN